MNGKGTSWESESTWSGGGGGSHQHSNSAVPGTGQHESNQRRKRIGKSRNAPHGVRGRDPSLSITTTTAWDGRCRTNIGTALWAASCRWSNQQAKTMARNGRLCQSGVERDRFVEILQCRLPRYNPTRSSNTSNGNPKRYRAVTGYDLATGWGSPKLNLINDLSPIPNAIQDPNTPPPPAPTQYTSIVFSIQTEAMISAGIAQQLFTRSRPMPRSLFKLSP